MAAHVGWGGGAGADAAVCARDVRVVVHMEVVVGRVVRWGRVVGREVRLVVGQRSVVGRVAVVVQAVVVRVGRVERRWEVRRHLLRTEVRLRVVRRRVERTVVHRRKAVRLLVLRWIVLEKFWLVLRRRVRRDLGEVRVGRVMRWCGVLVRRSGRPW